MHSLRVGTRDVYSVTIPQKEDPVGTRTASSAPRTVNVGAAKVLKALESGISRWHGEQRYKRSQGIQSHTRFRAWIEETRALFREATRRGFIVDGSTGVAAGAEAHNDGPPR